MRRRDAPRLELPISKLAREIDANGMVVFAANMCTDQPSGRPSSIVPSLRMRK